MKIKGAIFDMDGTLLNSMDYWSCAFEEFLIKNGYTPEQDSNTKFLEMGMKQVWEYYRDNHNLTISLEETRRQIYDIVGAHYDTSVEAKDGVIQMLDKLSSAGVKMCLATATDRDQVEKILKKLNMEKYFSKIFTTAEVGVGKASPLIYELALSHLGTKKDETYIFEDAAYAMKTAYENGFWVVGVYDKNVLVPKERLLSHCHYFIDEDSKYNIDFLM